MMNCIHDAINSKTNCKLIRYVKQLRNHFRRLQACVKLAYATRSEAKIEEDLVDLQLGITSLSTDPVGPENDREIFEIKRQTITTVNYRSEKRYNRLRY